MSRRVRRASRKTRDGQGETARTGVEGRLAITKCPPRPDPLDVLVAAARPRKHVIEADPLMMPVISPIGVRLCPLEWFEFFTTILDLARMECVLRSDLILYVDDLSHIGDEGGDALTLDQEGASRWQHPIGLGM